MKIISNIKVGKADVAPDAPAHIEGVRQGNNPPEQQCDILGVITRSKGRAHRSTGINPDNRNPIDPQMPHLSPP